MRMGGIRLAVDARVDRRQADARVHRERAVFPKYCRIPDVLH